LAYSLTEVANRLLISTKTGDLSDIELSDGHHYALFHTIRQLL